MGEAATSARERLGDDTIMWIDEGLGRRRRRRRLRRWTRAGGGGGGLGEVVGDGGACWSCVEVDAGQVRYGLQVRFSAVPCVPR